MTEQRTPEWFAQRKGRVTGSNVGAALGMNPYRTRDDLMRAMVREWHGAESEFQGNQATEHGNFHEDGAVFEFELETGLTVEKCGFFPFADWLGASPDGLVGDDSIVEIKCPYSGNVDRTAVQQPHYYAQMQVEMFCSDRRRAYFYQWSQGKTTLEIVERSDTWLTTNLVKLAQFHEEYLKERENPQRHLDPKRKEIDNNQARALMEEYDDLADAIERAEQRKKEVMQLIVQLCGEKDSRICGRNLTLVRKEGAVSYAKVVKDNLPDLDLSAYRGKESSYWRLS